MASEQRRLGHPHLGCRGPGGAWRWRWTRVGHGGACSGAWRPRRQNAEHVASVGEGEVGGRFGHFWSELVHGTKMKFGLHLMLSNFA